jgi:integrase
MKTAKIRKYPYSSVFADVFTEYVEINRAVGKKFDAEASLVWRFDRWCVENDVTGDILTRDVYGKWREVSPNEKNTNHRVRVTTMNRVVNFLREYGRSDFVPQPAPRTPRRFVPYIFTHDEIAQFFDAADNIAYKRQAPLAYKIYPLLFRMLYCCGMRMSEVTSLRNEHVDLKNGVLTVLHAKHNKDRLIPMSDSLTRLCRTYSDEVLPIGSEFFFPAPDGGQLAKGTVYNRFRDLLWKAGIQHLGRGKGPRVHDFRHSFSVHRLAQWSNGGIDLYTTIKLLSVYLGHNDLSSTQDYLRLTAEVFPDVTAKFEAGFGDVFQEMSV